MTRDVTNRLVQNSRHAIHEELEVLWAMQTTKEMSEEVFWCRSVASLRYRVQYEYQQQL
jgi:hypothetical protein